MGYTNGLAVDREAHREPVAARKALVGKAVGEFPH
jgi:hypothetical protein